MAAPRFILDDFWPSDLFLGGIPGAWYDPTDLSTMFQDSTGTTPVTAVEQPVGLIFDKSQGTPAARRNLLTYTEQFNDAYWFKAGGTISANTTLAPDGTTTADTWTATAGAARHELLSGIGAGPTTTANANHTFTLYVKKGTHNFVSLLVTANNTTWYVATFDFSGATPVVSKTGAGAGGVLVSTSIEAAANGFWRLGVTGRTTDAVSVCCPVLASSATPTYGIYGEENWTAAGTETTIFWGAQLEVGSTATTYQKITTGIGGEWTPGNHAYQSTAASRPTYRARYNLLTYSEQFNVAPWGLGVVSVTPNTDTAPDGTLTADTISNNAFGGVAFHYAFQNIPLLQNTTYTFSAYVKYKTGSGVIWILGETSSDKFCYFNVLTGTVGTTTGFVSASIQNVGNGWYRCSATFTKTSASANEQVGIGVAIVDGTPNWNDTGLPNTQEVYAWGAQLLTADDVTATGNAYQRIAAATVYDTAPIFRPYLAFDGVDDSLATAAINFTSTDKMTVFAGETKLQDATLGVLAELSTDAPGTNGTFWLLAPYTATERYSALSRGTSFTFANSNSALDVSPNTSVLTARLDISAPLTQLSVNRAVRATNTASQGTGNYGNWPLFIGRRNNSTFPFNGRLYSLIVRGAASSVTEIADTELWVNARTGAY